ncbi:MAG: hypothetical protein K9L26_03210 [Candidatus Izimaplasma sp.]|nr:hypothetical protein [Candidatus Izimaplasma bacterium]
MKKAILMTIFVLLMVSTKTSFATQYSDQLPGGKNYLDINNYTNRTGELNQVDPIRVLGDTDYVISVPPETYLENMEIHIVGEQTYVNGRVTEQTNCVVGTDNTYCTFHTTATESLLTVNFYAYHMDYHYDNFGIQDFQLEVGTLPTSYEEYVAPIDNTSPEISGEGAYVTTYESIESLTSIIDTHFTASDDIDGDLTNQIVVVYDEYTGNEQIVGSYLVTLEVTDSSNNTAQYNFTVIVKDTVLPVITGPTSLSIDVNAPPLIDTLLAQHFTFIDDYDGALTPVIIQDNYTPNNQTLGSYLVTVEVTDSSFNTVSHDVTINLEDNDSPQLDQTSTIDTYLSAPVPSIDLVAGILFSDNYNSQSELTVLEVSNAYTGNEDIVGIYPIELAVTDTSGNTLSTLITVTVNDDVAPILSGPSTLDVSYTKQLTTAEMIDFLNVTDIGDTVTIADIIVTNDMYSTNYNSIGDYTVNFSVTDASGNETTHQISISVVDNIPPVIYADEFLVTVQSSTIFDDDDVLLLLMQNGEIKQQNYTVKTLVNEYKGNEKTPGTYHYSVLVEGEDGDQVQKDFIINVVGTTQIYNSALLKRNIVIYSISFIIIIGATIKRKKMNSKT